MNVLIIGGEGFIGKNLRKCLTTAGVSFDSVSRSSDFKIDISRSEEFDKIPKDYYDIIIHLATVLPGGNYLDKDYLDRIYQTNILGTQNLCNWIKPQKSISKIINCSTLVVQNKPWPLNMNESYSETPTGRHVLYSVSKLMQEGVLKTFCENEKIALINLRLSAVYGQSMPWQGILAVLINKALSNEEIVLTNAQKVSFDFINVEDVSKVICQLLFSSANGTYNLASGNEIFLADLANLIVSVTKSQSKIINLEQLNHGEDRSKISIERLKEVVDINNFISLRDGLKELLR